MGAEEEVTKEQNSPFVPHDSGKGTKAWRSRGAQEYVCRFGRIRAGPRGNRPERCRRGGKGNLTTRSRVGTWKLGLWSEAKGAKDVVEGKAV